MSTDILFAGPEFRATFDKIVREDPSIPASIGAPSVFIFTAAGKTVYAGPNRPGGMLVDDEFKKLLISGIEQNGGIRRPISPAQAARQKTLAADLTQVKKLIAEKQIVPAAELLSKHVSSEDPETDDKQLDELVELTGLELAKSKSDAELHKLMTELGVRTPPLIMAAVAMGAKDKATVGAVKLAELERGFGKFPAQGPIFEKAWQQLLEASNIPDLREQAQMIDKARSAESRKAVDEAIEAYRLVTTNYPDTQAAQLSQQRIAQLEAAKPENARVWKSKSGKFSVKAALLSFDGTTATLKTTAGKVIKVKAEALSAEDQAFLEK